MSYLEYTVKRVPTGAAKLLHLNWALIIVVAAVAGIGFLMLTSVAGGRMEVWAEPQMKRFALGMALMFAVAFVPIWLWRNVAGLAYLVALVLLVAVDLFGSVGMGAQRWLNLGFMRLQPSELMKITLVLMLAAYYDWLPINRTSRPLWVVVPVLIVVVPTALVLAQPRPRHRDPPSHARRRDHARGRGALGLLRHRDRGGGGGCRGRPREPRDGLAAPARLPVPPHRHLSRPRLGPARGRATTSARPRSRSARAAGRARASCRARSRG